MKYRKKPVVVEAEQFKGVGWHRGHGVPYPRGVCWCSKAGGESHHTHVHTTHQGQAVHLAVGDWIVTEPDGEHFYPVKPDIFEQTYEPVGPIWKEADEG